MSVSPLSDIVVIDMTRLLPGPVATMMLRSLGARVIKVETTTAPDFLRFLPPHREGTNVAFEALNRGKESVVIDIESEQGSQIFRRLSGKADILLTSARKSWMQARGLDFESLRQENQNLIYCTLGSYRAGSEREKLGGHDINFLSLTGLSGLLSPGGDPVLPQVQLADLGGAQYAVICLLAALLERAKSNQGRELHLSLEEGCDPYTHLARALTNFAPSLTSVGPLAGQSPIYRYYKCADGKSIALGAIEPKFQARLKDILPVQTSHWPDDLFFQPAEAVHRELEEMFAAHDRAHWIKFFAPHDVCFSPVLEVSEVERDEEPLRSHFPSPRESVHEFGADTESVLLGLGYSKEEIDGWSQSGLLVTG